MGISKLISQLNWEGEFCFASPKWTEELKERVGYTFNDPSYYWMTVGDFQKTFDK